MAKWTAWVVVCSCFLGVIIHQVNAQNGLNQPPVDLSQPLTLQECVQVARENATDMRNARINLAIQDLRVKNARARYFPEIFLSGRYGFSDAIDFGFEQENYDLGLSGRYTLWDNGQREASFSQAKESRKATESRNLLIQQNLVFQVTQSYYNVLQAQELINVNEEVLARSRENTERVRAFLEVGSAIEADVATAQVREATDALALLNVQNNLVLELAGLPRIMGLDPGTVISLAQDTTYQLYVQKGEIEVFPLSIEEVIQLALENRPEVPEIQARIKQLEWDLTLAKLDRLPRLDAQYDYNVNLDDYLRERENFKDFRSWDVTATLNFTIFDGGVTQRRVTEAELALEQAREDATDLERGIALEVRQAYLTLKTDERRLEISNTQVRDAELSLEVTRGRYEVEEATLLDFLQVQTEYARVLTDQVRAFYDYKISQAALQRAMGVIQ